MNTELIMSSGSKPPSPGLRELSEQGTEDTEICLSEAELDEVKMYLFQDKVKLWEAYEENVVNANREHKIKCELIKKNNQAESHTEVLAASTSLKKKLNKYLALHFKALEQQELKATFEMEISCYGIEHTRNITVPAYTMTRFSEFPAEIRVKIWSYAARFKAPEVHHFACTEHWFNLVNVFRRRTLRSFEPEDYNRGSMLRYAHRSGKTLCAKIPICLQACKESRVETLKLLIKLPMHTDSDLYRSGGQLAPVGNERYYSAVDDSFYIGGAPWSHHIMLCQLLMKLNSTIPLSNEARLRLKEMEKIQKLIVDVNIFMDLPVRIWAEFPKLKDFAIAFYPFSDLHNNGWEAWCVEGARCPLPILKIPNMEGPYGARAALILEHVQDSFATLKKESPGWKIPHISVKLVAHRDPRGTWGVDGIAVVDETNDGTMIAASSKSEEGGRGAQDTTNNDSGSTERGVSAGEVSGSNTSAVSSESDGNGGAQGAGNELGTESESNTASEGSGNNERVITYDDTAYFNHFRERIGHTGYLSPARKPSRITFAGIDEIKEVHEKLSS